MNDYGVQGYEMKRKIPAGNIYVGNYDGHIARFHFSFADYEDSENGPFGVLQALNDFELVPGAGFGTHPHEEMEIISYCVEGTLEHVDNVGNQNTIGRGDVQYLCAGSGVNHSEMNSTIDGSLRFVQIWISPNKAGLTPNYRSKKFSKNSRMNEFQHVVSGETLDNAIAINQDANIYIAELEKQMQVTIDNRDGRQSYLLCLEGSLTGNGVELIRCDALKLWGKECLTLTALKESHILMVEMAKED
jgi:redox-sensitive bicupin YhaK (pirin superfamily)